MATKNQVSEICKIIEQVRPVKAFNVVNKHEMGIFAVIKFISENEEVKSVDISNFLGISSARMTVLLKKLEKKGIIAKKNCEVDARVVLVSLTEKGLEFAGKIKTKVESNVSMLIDEYGYDKLISLFLELVQIKSILDKNTSTDMEDLNV